MSEEHRENEIDDIFRQAIEPVNTEPSDRFWRKAAENIIARESKLNEKRASRWRAVAFILGAGLLMLGFFVYENGSGSKTVQNKNIISDNNHSTAETGNSTVNTTETSPKPILYKKTVIANTRDIEKQPAISKAKSGSASIANRETNKKPGKTNTSVLTESKLAEANKSIIEPKVPLAIAFTDKQASDKQKDLPQVQPEIASTLNVPKVSESVQKPDEKNTIISQPQIPAENKTIRLTASIPKDTTKKQGAADSSSSSRFSLSAFFSPEFMLNYRFKCTDSWGSEVEKNIETGEKQTFSYTAGINLNYELSSRFSIRAGIAFQVFSFDICPNTIYAEKQADGDVGYYLTTSSGKIKCPDYYGTPAIGDSLKMNATSSRTYMEIPLQLKYFIINKTKTKFYISAGIETNISVGEKTIINWQDYWNDKGVATITQTEGEENVYLSYSLGIGADFKISKRISLYAEPELHEAITSLDDNTSAITYPRLISANAGVTYHLQ